MATFILRNRHRAEDCDALGQEVQASPLPRALKGTQFLCTCPGGVHEAVFAVEAPTEKDALAFVPPGFRAGTRASAGEIFVIGEHEAVPVS